LKEGKIDLIGHSEMLLRVREAFSLELGFTKISIMAEYPNRGNRGRKVYSALREQ
jgi:hypothetical protein